MGKRKLTFEQALSELESIAEQIEQGKIGLAESIEKYERGMALVKQCRDMLSTAENKIQQLQQSADGAPKATPFRQTDQEE